MMPTAKSHWCRIVSPAVIVAVLALSITTSTTLGMRPSGLGNPQVLWGQSYALDLSSTHLYLGAGQRVHVLDAQRLDEPLLVGRSDDLPGEIVAVRVDEVRAQLWTIAYGLDRSHLCRMRLGANGELGAPDCMALDSRTWHIDIDDSWVYVADGHAGLSIVDGSPGADLLPAARFPTLSTATDVEVEGGIAFVTVAEVNYDLPGSVNKGRGVQMIDVSDPLQPADIGVLNQALGDGRQTIDAIVVRGEVALTYRSFDGEVHAYDIADPRDAQLLGSLRLPAGTTAPTSMKWHGDELFITHTPASAALSIIDVADPTAMTRTLIARPAVPEDDRWSEAVVAGEQVLLAHAHGGYQRLDRATGELSWPYTPVGDVLDITAAGELVLAALPYQGLVTLESADSLRERSRVGPGALSVEFADGHAYVLEQEPGRGETRALSLYSLANPDTPVQVGASIPAAGARGLDVANGVLLIFHQDVLRIYDVRDPSRPELQVELPMRSIRDVSLDAGVAYVLAGGQVHTIPVDGVRPPQIFSSTTVSSQSYSLDALDGMLAVAGERYGLSLYRLVDPLRPELIETLILGPDRQGWVYDVGLGSGNLFAWDLGGTLHQFDITADDPRLIAGQRLQGFRRHLAVGTGWVAVAGEGIALWPFDALDGVTSTPFPSVSPTMTLRPPTPSPTPDPPTLSPTPVPPTATPLDGRIWLPIVLRDYRQAREMSTRP